MIRSVTPERAGRPYLSIVIPAYNEEHRLESTLSRIDEYVRDNTAARQGDIEERTWTRVKFLKPHKIDVDADQNDGAGPFGAMDRSFDSSGLAVRPMLRQGGPTEFAPGDIAVFDSNSANRLIGQTICEQDGAEGIYRRPLRDYEYFYHKSALRFRELDDEMALVRRQTKAISDAELETDREIQFRQEEKQKLGEDLSHFRREASEVGKLLTTLKEQDEQNRSRLSYLYRENNRLAAELTRLQSQLRDLLDES